MKTSAKGLKLIKSHEGLRLNAYLCPAKVWTIGYGHTGTAEPGMVISQTQAEELLQSDLAWAEREINNLPVQLNQHQFDALVSLIFNIGPGNFGRSTARRLIVANPSDRAIGPAIELWNKASGRVLPGLVRRRKEEAELYFQPI